MSLYKDASLVMIPSAYKDGKLYSIRPTDGDGDFTFSRGSNLAATRVDVNGLIEKGRENLLTYSNDFSNADWTKYNGVTLSGGESGYDGSNNAWLVTKPSTSFTGVGQNVLSASGVITFSVYMKAGTLSVATIRLIGIPDRNVVFDLSNGTIFGGSSTGWIDRKIESAGGGWYKCSFTLSNTGSSLAVIYPDEITNTTGGSIYIQDAQLEAGLVATDYIETGASTAQSGILEDMPRLDYSGGASCPALLLEPQRTNLVTHSEYALDSSWTTQLGTLTANAATSPEGVNNAVKFLETAAGGRHRSYTSHNTNAGTYCVSVFMKDGNRGYGFLHWAMEGGDGRFSIIVDLSDGQVVDTMSFSGSEVIVDYGTEDYGNGWYRAYIVGTKATSNVSYVNFGLASSDNDTNSSGTPSYTGDGTHYAYFYGMQTEAGSYPTSYIPTYGTSVTRSVDSCLATSVSDAIGQSSGTFFVDFITPDTDSYFINAISDGTNSNKVQIEYNTTANTIKGIVRVSNNTIVDITATGKVPNTRYKAAISYAENDFVLYVNGVKIGTDTSGSIPPSMSRIDIGTQVGTFYGTGDVNQMVLFQTKLTDSEAIALTTI